jgi:ABC-type uncharacterized transport system fused permease/ATPase subunit
VGHRATLRSFHARQLTVKRTGSGPAYVVEETPTSRPRAG